MYLSDIISKIFTRNKNLIRHFNKGYCRIYFLVDIQAVHLEWNGTASTVEFKEACNFSLSLMIEKKAKKMIADNSKVISVSRENQDWLTQEWFPKAIEKGFQYSAVIQSDKDMVRSALQLIVSKISSKHVIVQNFNELATAKKWLAGVS
jgi:hypothetical protein